MPRGLDWRQFRVPVLAVILLAAALFSKAGWAQEEAGIQAGGLDGFLSEIRVGAVAHDVGFFGNQREGGVDANLELLLVPPPFLDILWSPRPHLGVTVNAEGDTSFLYVGGTWDIADILDRAFGWGLWDPLLMEGTLGLALHNGELSDSDAGPSAKAMGCRLLFREALSLGIRFWRHHSISFMLDHISNSGLCDDNDGIETVGIRYGYRF